MPHAIALEIEAWKAPGASISGSYKRQPQHKNVNFIFVKLTTEAVGVHICHCVFLVWLTQTWATANESQEMREADEIQKNKYKAHKNGKHSIWLAYGKDIQQAIPH